MESDLANFLVLCLVGGAACVKLLLEKGEEVLDHGEDNALKLSPLHSCCMYYSKNRFQTFRLLLETGYDINQADAIGRTPLMFLIEAGDDVRRQVLRGGSSFYLFVIIFFLSFFLVGTFGASCRTGHKA